MRIYKFLSCFVAMSVSLGAFGWGQTGHRVVGQVAETHLSRKAKKNIARILGNESLAMASTWMDEVKSDDAYDHTHDWHWVTIPDGKRYDDTDKNPEGDLVEAIGRMTDILKSDTTALEEKREALRFLVHLVGDLHQPLHVGTGKDQGGNEVKVKWFYDNSNLHRVWDSEIIDSKQLSYMEIACNIDHATDEQVEQWQEGTPEEWAHEVMAFRSRVYNTGNPEKMGYRYMYENWDLVQLQLEKAGIRLAGMLNEIFG